MLVRGKDLDRLAGVLRGRLGNGVRELFLNAAASSGVADFGFFGFSSPARGQTRRSAVVLSQFCYEANAMRDHGMPGR
jgi:hypothetical protein